MIEMLVLSMVISLVSADADAKIKRSATAVAQFKRANLCPSTNKKGNYKCPGYVVDHIKPLCFGGADDPKNMQYQTIADALKKDEFEREACELLRKCKP